jgi:3-oxoacyl-[acyl-carrier-protein] synthase-3
MVAGELGWREVACFDVNATCLSFVAALQVAAGMFAMGRYRRIAIVSTEIASKGLNWNQPEAAGLMGDGAAAAILEADPDGESALLRWAIKTWPEGAAYTEIRGGGSRIPSVAHRPGENSEDFLFHMDGPAVFRLAAEKIGRFVDGLIGTDAHRWDDIDWVVPHQPRVSGLRRLGRRLGIPREKMIQTVRTQGNVIAASIPLAMHEAITSGRLRRGQTVLLLGTSAGFSLGGAVLRY